MVAGPGWEQWLDWGSLFKVEPRVFASGLDEGVRERRGQRVYSKVLTGASGGLWLPLTDMGTGRAGCRLEDGELGSGCGCETERCLGTPGGL